MLTYHPEGERAIVFSVAMALFAVIFCEDLRMIIPKTALKVGGRGGVKGRLTLV